MDDELRNGSETGIEQPGQGETADQDPGQLESAEVFDHNGEEAGTSGEVSEPDSDGVPDMIGETPEAGDYSAEGGVIGEEQPEEAGKEPDLVCQGVTAAERAGKYPGCA